MPPPATNTRGRRVSGIAFLAQLSAVPAFAGKCGIYCRIVGWKWNSIPASQSADEQQRRLFEIALDALDERGCLPAVDDAVIERRGQVHHLADYDLTVTHHRSLGDAVDADDRDLGVIDHRRRGEAAERAEAGDRDRRTGQLVARRLAGASCFG